MLDLSEIREDLKEIKYYYSHKDIFEKASKEIGEHSCIAKIGKYNEKWSHKKWLIKNSKISQSISEILSRKISLIRRKLWRRL